MKLKIAPISVLVVMMAVFTLDNPVSAATSEVKVYKYDPHNPPGTELG